MHHKREARMYALFEIRLQWENVAVGRKEAMDQVNKAATR